MPRDPYELRVTCPPRKRNFEREAPRTKGNTVVASVRLCKLNWRTLVRRRRRKNRENNHPHGWREREREWERRGRDWWKPDARSTPPLSSGHSVQSGTAALIEGLPAVNRLDRMDGWVDGWTLRFPILLCGLRQCVDIGSRGRLIDLNR